MEDGLVHEVHNSYFIAINGLNPYCNGRWSRTVLIKKRTIMKELS